MPRFCWAISLGVSLAMARLACECAVIGFRRAADDSARSFDQACLQELTALARDVLAAGLTAEAAVLAMARELGLQRLRAASRGRFDEAIATRPTR